MPKETTERAVFAALAFVQSRLSSKVAAHVASQLPRDLELMWREAAAIGTSRPLD